jgi:hypothetical protein
MPVRALASVLLAVLVLPAVTADAREVFVDNRLGRDTNNGEGRVPTNGIHGPKRTIASALKLLGPGDTLTLVNTGMPYYESITLDGPRFSGVPFQPTTINGNGSVLSGARQIPPTAWQYVGGGLWRFRPWRKGWYQLMLDGQALPEVKVERGAKALPELPEGQWCAWQSYVWYRAKLGPGERPLELPFEFAYDSVGISLVNVDNVVIRDLTIRHFRQDGANAHDRANAVIFDRVQILENGRAGLSASGTSLVGLRDSIVQGNRETQILNAEVAQTELENVDFGTVENPFQIKGGHVLRDGEEVFP